uniref:Uncharacterized protein n=1 Tax=Neobodo designis TaxID=312471 RepID=A0A7S1LEA6_NEODS
MAHARWCQGSDRVVAGVADTEKPLLALPAGSVGNAFAPSSPAQSRAAPTATPSSTRCCSPARPIIADAAAFPPDGRAPSVLPRTSNAPSAAQSMLGTPAVSPARRLPPAFPPGGVSSSANVSGLATPQAATVCRTAATSPTSHEYHGRHATPPFVRPGRESPPYTSNPLNHQ